MTSPLFITSIALIWAIACSAIIFLTYESITLRINTTLRFIARYKELTPMFWEWADTSDPTPLWYNLCGGPVLPELIVTAKINPSWTVKRIVNIKKCIILATCFLYIALSIVFAFTTAGLYTATAILAATIILPSRILRQRAEARQQDAARNLTNLINLLKLHISSGSNIENAFTKLPRTLGETLDEEIAKVVFCLNHGIPFEIVIEEMAQRLKVNDLDQLIFSVKHAKELGISLTSALRVQQENIQTRRRQNAEKKARAATIKIIFPLVGLLIPAMLMILGAPVFLTMS